MKTKVTRFIVGLLIFIVAFSVPLFKLNFDIASILTVIALIFAILVGFFIAAATANYLQLQSLIAEEDSSLISIYQYSKIISPESISKIAEVIDNYAISALSFELTEYVRRTDKEFDELSNAVEEINFKDGKGEQLIQSLYDKKNSLYRTRQSVALVARRIVTTSHWFILASLTILIDLLLLATRDGSFFSYLITGILFVVTYLVLILLHDVDNNRFLEQALSYENSQQIFSILGRPKYYAEEVIKSGRVLEPKESYRTGYYKSADDKSIILKKR